jgi:DNA-directed RNA polymerase specialized sigma24 family protein
MTPRQAIAMLHVKQWRDDRTKISAGISGIYKRNGYRERRQRDADARIVRTLDFEKALAQIGTLDQSMLISAYYLGHTRKETADATGVSERAIIYKLPMALDALAATLERLALL